MTGVTDLDLLAFARAVASELPGDVRVVAFSLERRSDARAGPARAACAPASAVDLVDGRLQLEWRALRSAGPRRRGRRARHEQASALLAALLLTAAPAAVLAAAPAPAADRGCGGAQDRRRFVAVLEPGARPDRGRAGRRAARRDARGAVRSSPTPVGGPHPPVGDRLSRARRLADLAERRELHARRAPARDRDPRGAPPTGSCSPGAREPGAPPTRVELRPNQTYVVASGAVVEGNP